MQNEPRKRANTPRVMAALDRYRQVAALGVKPHKGDISRQFGIRLSTLTDALKREKAHGRDAATDAD
jgi:hypothetical protein